MFAPVKSLYGCLNKQNIYGGLRPNSSTVYACISYKYLQKHSLKAKAQVKTFKIPIETHAYSIEYWP